MPARRLEVFALTGAYTPVYKASGATRSIENLVSTLGEEFHFRIVAPDRALNEKSPFPGIVTNRWIRVGQADVMYLRPGFRGLVRMWILLRSTDRDTILYLNSFFSRHFGMLPALMRWCKLCQPRCLVLAPRGETSLGALQFKAGKKLSYIKICRWLGVYRNVIWQASSDLELEDIRRQFPLAVAANSGLSRLDRSLPSVVITAPDIATPVPAVPHRNLTKTPGQLRAVFVSRLSRKKNLSGALRAFAGVSGDVTFDIYGPAEDAAYWDECQTLIAALPINIRARSRGEIDHEKVQRVFAEAHLFFFPTHSENYGHVISEALAAGCPVLISDQTPWRNLEVEGVGWDIPLTDTERFRSVLQQCVNGGDEWFTALSRRASNYAMARASDPETLDANRRLFQWAAAGDRRDTSG
jgi:glycosyltransferase involved in cell wall biosynthesis